MGNIYASEACFLASVDPQKRVKDLTDEEIKKIHQGVVKSLTDGVKYGGSTRTHFVNAEGKKGLFLDYASVYNREGQKCKKCDEVLVKIRLGGRGTVYCPSCQR